MRKLDQIVNSNAFKTASADSCATFLGPVTIELVFDNRATASKHRRRLDEAGCSMTNLETTTMPWDYSTTAYVFHIIA